MSEQKAEVLNQFTHSIKIEQSAKGARVTVHVEANSKETAMMQAIDLYISTQKELVKLGQVVAPIEAAKSKE